MPPPAIGLGEIDGTRSLRLIARYPVFDVKGGTFLGNKHGPGQDGSAGVGLNPGVLEAEIVHDASPHHLASIWHLRRLHSCRATPDREPAGGHAGEQRSPINHQRQFGFSHPSQPRLHGG